MSPISAGSISLDSTFKEKYGLKTRKMLKPKFNGHTNSRDNVPNNKLLQLISRLCLTFPLSKPAKWLPFTKYTFRCVLNPLNQQGNGSCGAVG
jgi:hypothetical protein